MSSYENWANERPTLVRQTCFEAARVCAKQLPQPYNYISYLGYNFRRKRLENELLEFAFRYRIARGAPASLKQLVCIGDFLIDSQGGTLPASPMPVDEEFLVNQHTTRLLMRWLDVQSGDAPERTIQ